MAGKFTSSTQAIPGVSDVPRHIAIIMDGNGRWAKKRFMPRVAGHKRGVETVRAMVKACIARGVEYLTLFAFSSENWRRPAEEVSFLMNLFVAALQAEIVKLHANGVRLKVVGELSAFEPRLLALIREGEARTANNARLTLTIAANYGGRWDILQAMNQLALAHPEKAGCCGYYQCGGHSAGDNQSRVDGNGEQKDGKEFRVDPVQRSPGTRLVPAYTWADPRYRRCVCRSVRCDR